MEVLDSKKVLRDLGYEYLRELSAFGALSDAFIGEILRTGTIELYRKGEYITRIDETADSFQIVLRGKMAFYKHFETHDVLTRYFSKGEQIGFDLMLGMIQHNGTDVAVEDSQILYITDLQFFGFHESYSEEFGLLMINMARELSREIGMLEDVIGNSTGWL